MPRHNYPLSDETREAITDNVKELAEEMNIRPQQLYLYLSGAETDPFAKFIPLYQALVIRDKPYKQFKARLDAIEARFLKTPPPESLAKCLTKILKSNAETASNIAEALEDGFIDDREANVILRAIRKERAALDLIETRLHFQGETA